MKTALTLALISMILSACMGAATTAVPTPTREQPTAAATATRAPTLTSTPDALATHIANRKATKEIQQAKIGATKTARAENAMALLAQIREASPEIEGVDFDEASLVAGPSESILRHRQDELVTTYEPNLRVRNFILSIRFVNPYDTAQTGRWDYGILFRNHYGNDQYRLAILSNQSWTLVDANTWTNIYARNDKHLTSQAGEHNTIWLIVVKKTAHLFINGAYIQSLDVSANLDPGDVSPATGLYYGNEIDQKTTEFYDFTVWHLP